MTLRITGRKACEGEQADGKESEGGSEARARTSQGK